MERNIQEIISKMTIEEKASLCSGLDMWHTKPVERLAIPSIMMTDGPHGLRKQIAGGDHLGINDSVSATCFPTASAVSSSWDINLISKIGVALGEECQAEDVRILLGPGINIKRSPLCGRNFEYFSEDPYISGELGAAWIKGVQSQGVGTSLKHFAVNNQEFERMTISSEVDERTLREIYLAGFEKAVKEAKPKTVMCAYNKLNGTYCSENPYLLTNILRDEWGFEGFVVSDWGAVDRRVEGLEAGLELEMPSSAGITDKKIVEAVKTGTLDERILDTAVERILNVVFEAHDKRMQTSFDKEAHHDLARSAAEDCIVLLKNKDNILPINKSKVKNLAIIGEFAKKPRYQGGGSSHVKVTKLENAYEEIVKTAKNDIEISYSAGYSIDDDEVNLELINVAKNNAKEADMAILFIGLPERYESEGFDRAHMNMPINHIKLIEEISSVQENVVVVLSNGSVIEIASWEDRVKGILEGWLTGQATGGAIANILFGIATPSGKLAETFPIKLSENPSYLNFPGKNNKVRYQEGVFVGYRYYDAKEMEVMYPFGFGLSYTTFEYSALHLNKKEMLDTETLEVSLKVKNTGNFIGKEIIQLYVSDNHSNEIRPVKELKAFTKIELRPNEEKEVVLILDKRAFAYYDIGIKDWKVDTGEFGILIGKSSRDICLKEVVKVISSQKIKNEYTRNSTLGELLRDPKGVQIVEPMIKGMLSGFANQASGDDTISRMMEAMIGFMPLRSMVTFSNGAFTEEGLEDILRMLNE